MATDTMLVRLKPFNRKKGHVLRCYTYRGIRFFERRGWTRVRKEIADYVQTVHQIPDDEDSPLAFDTCSEGEAKAIDKREAQEAQVKTPAEQAKDVAEARDESAAKAGGDLDTADLPQNRRRRGRK